MELITDSTQWDAAIAPLPGAQLLQSWAWGEFKRRNGWEPRRWVWREGGQAVAAAQVLTRTAGGGLARVLYVPKGPLLAWENEARQRRVLDDLEALARRERAILLKIDPDVPLSLGLLEAELPQPTGQKLLAALPTRGWRFSPDQIQFRNTVLLDLRPNEDVILAAMKQKTRYNVRLAEKKGVRVRQGTAADLDLLYKMYAETSVRDGFVIRGGDYYTEAWGRFITLGHAQPFIAEVEGEPVSAILVFQFAKRALYMYGMSRNLHRDKMPNHLLQWEAMRWAKAQGCETYDFWGAPDEFNENDSMWGVWKFKEGFNGQVARHLGAWDYAPSPALYRLYTTVLPRILDFMRRRGKARTKQAVA